MRPDNYDGMTFRVAQILGWTKLEWRESTPDSTHDFDKFFGSYWGHPPRWMRKRDWCPGSPDIPTFEQFDKIHGEYSVAEVPQYARWYDGMKDIFDWFELVLPDNDRVKFMIVRGEKWKLLLNIGAPNQEGDVLITTKKNDTEDFLPKVLALGVEFLHRYDFKVKE